MAAHDRPRTATLVPASVAALALLLGLLASCGSRDDLAGSVVGISVAPDHRLEPVTTGFDRPTQLVAAGEDHFAIAQLAGGENDAAGQVLLTDRSFGRRTVIQRGLDKPTGIAVIGETLFIQERDRLVRTSLAAGAPLEPVVDEQPNNGRSQGSLTVAPDGALLFDTSGAKRGAERLPGSGTLWRLPDPLDPRGPPMPLATGFKHAYAHTHADDGRLFSVEMSDGTFDGQRASDELIVVVPGDDAGWPFCVDDNRPVAEFGGTPERCSTSPRSHALFEPGATPTALVVAPWDPAVLIVALWIPGQIVAVPVDAADEPHAGEVIVDGIESPQSLLVDGDRVLIVDHASGSIYALTRD